LLNTKSQQEKAAKISPHYATQRCSVGWCRWCSYFATGATTFMAFGIENLHKFQRAVKPPPSREAVVFWQQSLHLIDTSWAPKRVEGGATPKCAARRWCWCCWRYFVLLFVCPIANAAHLVFCCYKQQQFNNRFITQTHMSRFHTIPSSWLEK